MEPLKYCSFILLLWLKKILSVKLSNSQLNKLKSRIENGIEVTLNLASNLICNSNDKVDFPHILLLTFKAL